MIYKRCVMLLSTCVLVLFGSLEGAEPILSVASQRLPVDADSVRTVAFSPDGKILATGGTSGHTVLWNTATWKPAETIRLHEKEVTCVRFSKDGSRIASSGRDGRVIVWDVRDRKEILTINQDISQGFVEWSPDQRFLVTGTDEYFTHGNLKLWDARSGELVREFKRETRTRHAIFTPDGKQLISTRLGHSVEVFDVASGDSVYMLRGLGEQSVFIDISSDAKMLAVATHDGVEMWSLEHQRRTVQFRGHSDDVTAACLSPDDAFVVSSSWDGGVKIWSVKSGEQMANLKGHKNAIWALAFSPDGRMLVSGGDSSELIVWWLNPMQQPTELKNGRNQGK